MPRMSPRLGPKRDGDKLPAPDDTRWKHSELTAFDMNTGSVAPGWNSEASTAYGQHRATSTTASSYNHAFPAAYEPTTAFDSETTSVPAESGVTSVGGGAWNMFRRLSNSMAVLPSSIPGFRKKQDNKLNDIQSIAAEILMLAYTVCSCSPTDCLKLANGVVPGDRLAFRRVSELASLHGLTVPPLDQVRDFLRSRHPENKRASFARRGRSRSNFSNLSADKKRSSFQNRGRSASHLSNLSADTKRARFQSKGRSVSNLSNQSKRSVSSGTDFSDSSFMAFDRKGQGFRLARDHNMPSFLDFMKAQDGPRNVRVDNGMPLVMEINLPPVEEGGCASNNSVKMLLPNEDHSIVGMSETGQSEGAATYHSTCDAVLVGEDGERETVRADVMNFGRMNNMGGGGGGSNQVRIEFRSQCLRTQNEWQKQLLMQQRSLMDTISNKLESAEQTLRKFNEIQDAEKELLRGFRKIITREIDMDDGCFGVEIFVVEKNEQLTTQMVELCQILEYPCQAFRSLRHATEAVKNSAINKEEEKRLHAVNKAIRRSGTTKSALSLIAGSEGRMGGSESEWASERERRQGAMRRSGSTKSVLSITASERTGVSLRSRLGLRRSVTTKSSLSCASAFTSASMSTTSSDIGGEVQVIFLGVECLARELPAEWKESGVYVVLTSMPEEFEQVGRTLMASGKAEIQEKLHALGISEYLLHPLSLEGMRQVLMSAMRRHFGHEYLLTNLLGHGSSGAVYKAKRISDGECFALKEINMKGKHGEQQTQQEINLLKALKWPTLMDIVDAWVVGKLRYLLLPLLDGGDISQQIEVAKNRDRQEIPIEQVADWYVQSLHGVSYLHSCGVLHRDLKPGNLLLGLNDHLLQIGDLGSALDQGRIHPGVTSLLVVVPLLCTLALKL